MIKGKDSIFALPNRKETGFIARLENLKREAAEAKVEAQKKKFFFEKACEFKKKLYFCSRFENEKIEKEIQSLNS